VLEEKIINGRLCFRLSEMSSWIEYDKEDLTMMLKAAQKESEMLKQLLSKGR
jgi:hypothetical protein